MNFYIGRARTYAGVWLRLKAFAFDYLLIFGYMKMLLIFSVFLKPSIQGWFQDSQLTAQLAGFFLLTLPISLYFFFRIQEWAVGRLESGGWISVWSMKTIVLFLIFAQFFGQS